MPLSEQEDVMARFMEELAKPTGDGKQKRARGEKPPWYQDSHEAQVFNHIAKWKRGELVDPDSGAHPLVHCAWRCLAIACRESGNVPGKRDVSRELWVVHKDTRALIRRLDDVVGGFYTLEPHEDIEEVRNVQQDQSLRQQ